MREIFHYNDKGDPFDVDAYKLAALFAAENKTIFCRDEDEIYQYQSETGLYSRLTKQQAMNGIEKILMREIIIEGSPTALLKKKTVGFLAGTVDALKGVGCKEGDIFARQKIIHCKNGVLVFEKGEFALKKFSPSFWSRNRIEIDFDAKAKCPRFLNELLLPMLPEHDIEMLQRIAGQMVIGNNICQKILLMIGLAGTGKTTQLQVFGKIIGRNNISALRTDLLAERFEFANYVGKTMLEGRDVSSDYLQHPTSSALKSLCGGDLLGAEIKGVRHHVQFCGSFNIVITSNSRQKAPIDNDLDAWRRRLVIIDFDRPRAPGAKIIPGFADILVAEEGQGIFAWMVEGATRLLNDIDAGRGFQMNEIQRGRVDRMLDESDSIRIFINRKCERNIAYDISTDELCRAYNDFCDDNSWAPTAQKAFESRAGDLMLQIHRVTRAHDIKRNGKNCRGFRGIKLNHVFETEDEAFQW